MNKTTQTIKRLFSLTSNLLILILLLATLASFSGKFLGVNNKDWINAPENPKEKILKAYPFLTSEGWKTKIPGVWEKDADKNSRNASVIFSQMFAKDIHGFGGPIYLLIFLNHEKKITRIDVGENYETPEFVQNIIEKGWLKQFFGKKINQVVSSKYDGVTGATISSEAIVNIIKKTSNTYLAKIGVTGLIVSEKSWIEKIGWKRIASILALISAVTIFVFFKGSSGLRLAQLILNVIVLGFLGGSILSMQGFIKIATNGLNFGSSLVTTLMICVIVILLVFDKKNFYCYWVCPYGSFQELMGKLTKSNITFSPKLQKFLNNLRQYLFYCLLFLSWLLGGSWIFKYEPFAAFLLNQASWSVLIIAGLFLVSSIFVKRCWCRFVCPTGAAITFVQNTKTE